MRKSRHVQSCGNASGVVLWYHYCKKAVWLRLTVLLPNLSCSPINSPCTCNHTVLSAMPRLVRGGGQVKSGKR